MSGGARDQTPGAASDEPVELYHIDGQPQHEFHWAGGPRVEGLAQRVLLDKRELAVLELRFERGAELALHTLAVDRALYVTAGAGFAWMQDRWAAVAVGDSLFVPAGSGIALRGDSRGGLALFVFLAGGPLADHPFIPLRDAAQSEDQPTALDDDAGMPRAHGPAARLVPLRTVPWENWQGPLGTNLAPDVPLAWRTLIDEESLVLGFTRIAPGCDVDRHRHRQTQLIFFSEAEGETHIRADSYQAIRSGNYIYPPPLAMHHTINKSATSPLLEIYFFPSGPFSAVEYLFE